MTLSRLVSVARSQVMFVFCIVVLTLNLAIALVACSGASSCGRSHENERTGHVKNQQAQRGLLKAAFLQSAIFLSSWMPTVILGGAHAVSALTPEQVRIAKTYSVCVDYGNVENGGAHR